VAGVSPEKGARLEAKAKGQEGFNPRNYSVTSLCFLGFGLWSFLLFSRMNSAAMVSPPRPAAPCFGGASSVAGVQVGFLSGIWPATSSRSRIRQKPALSLGVALVQAFQYVISTNLQNCTVNYTKDLLRATPSAMFFVPALTTLLLVCSPRSLHEAQLLWSMPSACSEHGVSQCPQTGHQFNVGWGPWVPLSRGAMVPPRISFCWEARAPQTTILTSRTDDGCSPHLPNTSFFIIIYFPALLFIYQRVRTRSAHPFCPLFGKLLLPFWIFPLN